MLHLVSGLWWWKRNIWTFRLAAQCKDRGRYEQNKHVCETHTCWQGALLIQRQDQQNKTHFLNIVTFIETKNFYFKNTFKAMTEKIYIYKISLGVVRCRWEKNCMMPNLPPSTYNPKGCKSEKSNCFFIKLFS